MGFKIRTDNEGSNDKERYETSIAAYRKHLEKFDKRSNTDLWRYFYWDFFHDGCIQDISLRNGADELIIEITCPNIKRRTKGDDFEYINVDFTCTFTEVALFRVQKLLEEEEEDVKYRYPGIFQFLCSEINTLPELTAFNKNREEFEKFDSLIVEVTYQNSPNYSYYIELIFNSLSVEAVENTAFQLMLVSPDFEVPIYRIED